MYDCYSTDTYIIDMILSLIYSRNIKLIALDALRPIMISGYRSVAVTSFKLLKGFKSRP